MSLRPILENRCASATMEGAGVRLHRAFGFEEPTELDPFLLFDDFRNDRPEDFAGGFPWHPHRGIETITFVLKGSIEHGDSLGHFGVLQPGDVQWLSSGSGIMHQEMLRANTRGQMHGFQLWCNLPGHQKMSPPRFRDLRAGTIPTIRDPDGVTVRVIAGTYGTVTGPLTEIACQPQLIDVTMPAGTRRVFRVPGSRRAFAYVYCGAALFDRSFQTAQDESSLSRDRTLVRFGDGDEIEAMAGPAGLRFLLVTGLPIAEPVVWQGPIVMNTQEEIRQALADLANGTFVRGPAQTVAAQ